MKLFQLLALAAIGTASAAATLCAADADGKYNVLFIMSDDLNCDLGCYGHPQVKSPNIDRLAKRGLRFERTHCQFPLCGPSRASIMCGLYPDQTLVQQNAIYVRQRVPNVQTMPQMFRNHGYTAMRIGKIYHYGVPGSIGTDGHDDPDSWNKVVNPRGRDKDDESLVVTLRPGQYGGTLSWLAAEGTDEEQTDGIGATAAVKLLEQFAANKTPFFLGVGFYRPHTPYVSPKKYFDMYPQDKIVVPNVPAGYMDTLPQPARDTLTRKQEQVDLPEETARKAIQAYYASITFMDAQVGRVLDALEKTGLDKNTIVVFTSDHGYHMGEHAYYQKMTLFENATRVPLIISVPGMKTAGQSTQVADRVAGLLSHLGGSVRFDPAEHSLGRQPGKPVRRRHGHAARPRRSRSTPTVTPCAPIDIATPSGDPTARTARNSTTMRAIRPRWQTLPSTPNRLRRSRSFPKSFTSALPMPSVPRLGWCRFRPNPTNGEANVARPPKPAPRRSDAAQSATDAQFRR